MRIVPQAVTRPHHCAMYPHLGSAHRKGYFDVGSELPGFDNHGYVSVEFVESAARHLKWVSADEVKTLTDEIGRLERECADLREQLREADQFAEAAEYTLNHFNTKVKQKPGRKPAKEEV